MTTFYLVRHAHADWMPDENRPLSARGRADAERVADILAEYPIRAIYASPSLRAIETIAPLARRLGLPVQIEPDLRERQLDDVAAEDFLQAVEATWRDPALAHQGGESNAAAQRRGLAVVRRLQGRHGEEQIVLSTHGNLLALILQGFDPAVDFAFWQSLTMPDIYALSFDRDGEAAMRRLWWSQVYEIRFMGHLSPARAEMFEGLEMTQKPDGETVLTGPIVDQAALHGVLNRIRDLGLPLLSVKAGG